MVSLLPKGRKANPKRGAKVELVSVPELFADSVSVGEERDASGALGNVAYAVEGIGGPGVEAVLASGDFVDRVLSVIAEAEVQSEAWDDASCTYPA
jgi:hypothetical protein